MEMICGSNSIRLNKKKKKEEKNVFWNLIFLMLC